MDDYLPLSFSRSYHPSLSIKHILQATKFTVTLSIKHYKNEEGIEKIDIDQRRCKVSELHDEFLKENWTVDTLENGVQSYVVSDTAKSKKTWIANQTWGIQDINGERRYVRNVKFGTRPGEDIEALLVYGYAQLRPEGPV
ncbi:hypothetical protein B0H13DRAFT_2579056 [Mycena leptocephala]|nr:hypothetical protein B0H13DRAFT_2579056 [Mycena leptocephala]